MRTIYAFRIMTTVLGFSIFSGCGGGSGDHSTHLAGEFYFHSHSPIDRFIAPLTWRFSEESIPSTVVEYKFNDSYIVACRNLIVIGDSGSRTSTDRFDYWIVDIAGRDVLGPLDWETFAQYQERLGIRHTLSIKRRSKATE